jgi:N-acetylneuraminic acid mutarotase
MTISTLQAAGQWTTTGDLPAASSWHGQQDGAILLQNGKVLVVGGADAASAARSEAAVYDPDPAAKTWTAIAPLQTARRLHSATLLANGKVLVVGGITGSPQFPAPGLGTAELYDPGAGTWSTTGSLHVPRWGHTATLLADGKVLVAGGSTVRFGQSLKALHSAELYNPSDGTWTDAASMTDARSGHAAVVLDNGFVLVCGGSAPVAPGEDAALAYCELYDGKKWLETGSLLAPRSRHQATLLAAGAAVLVTGGGPPGAPGDGTFDPFSRASAERYDRASGAWSAVADMPGGRSLHRAVALGSGKVLVIGGADSARNDAGYQSALIFDSAATPSWTVADGLSTGRWAFAATALADGRVLVTGGTVRSGLAAASPDTNELTASTEVFSATGGTP